MSNICLSKFCKGFPNILETCGQLIAGKISLLKQLPIDYLKQQTDVNCSLKEFPYATLVSNLTTFENDIVLCDTGRANSVFSSS